MNIDDVLDMLACPHCHGSLAFVGGELRCESCQSSYAVKDGIPILLPEAAIQKDASGGRSEFHKRYWDSEKEAARYQTDLTPMAAYKRVTERFLPIRLARIREGDTVLDAGCGTGRQLVQVSKQNKVIGLDRSFVMLTRARKKADPRNSFFVVGDVLSPPFKSGVFDSIISVRLIQHLNVGEKIQFFLESHRMLTSGGRINLVTYKKSTPHWWYIKLGTSKIRHAINFPFKMLYLLLSIPAGLIGKKIPQRLGNPLYWHAPNISRFSSQKELKEQLSLAGYSNLGFHEFQIGDVFFANRLRIEKLLANMWEALVVGYYDLCWRADARNVSQPTFLYKYFTIKDKIFAGAEKK